jgi:predicted enzyme related to lactoylglutathione lyase
MSNTTTTPTSTDQTSAVNTVSWFEIHSADPARAKSFYADVFGWEFDDSMPGYSMIELGDGAPIGGGIADNKGEYPNNAVFMVQVADVAATLAVIRQHGGSVVADVQETPFGLSFGYAANPDGSVFGLWCPPAG